MERSMECWEGGGMGFVRFHEEAPRSWRPIVGEEFL